MINLFIPLFFSICWFPSLGWEDTTGRVGCILYFRKDSVYILAYIKHPRGGILVFYFLF